MATVGACGAFSGTTAAGAASGFITSTVGLTTEAAGLSAGAETLPSGTLVSAGVLATAGITIVGAGGVLSGTTASGLDVSAVGTTIGVTTGAETTFSAIFVSGVLLVRAGITTTGADSGTVAGLVSAVTKGGVVSATWGMTAAGKVVCTGACSVTAMAGRTVSVTGAFSADSRCCLG